MRTAMKDNKSMDFALEEAMKERGIVSEVVGAPVVYYNGHHYTLDHDTKTGLFSVLHTTGRDRGYRVLGEAGKTRLKGNIQNTFENAFFLNYLANVSTPYF